MIIFYPFLQQIIVQLNWVHVFNSCGTWQSRGLAGFPTAGFHIFSTHLFPSLIFQIVHSTFGEGCHYKAVFPSVGHGLFNKQLMSIQLCLHLLLGAAVCCQGLPNSLQI